MAYIGSFPADKTSGSKPRNEFAGDGSTVNFTLSQEVPGGFESNVLVIVDNVLQQPVESYTIGGDNVTLQFSEAPASGAVIYVLHQGNATYQMIPVVGSVTPDKLSENLRNFTVDTYTGDGTTVAYTLSDTPASANSILVIVDGIFQTKTTNYTLSGTTLTFTGAPDSGAAITVIHLGFSTVSRTAVPDGSITTAKIADNAITSAKLGFDVIVAEDIAANAITVSELQNGAVTPAKLSTGGPFWDTSSNVGIGTSSPSTQLQMNSGATTYSDQLRIRNTNYGNADIGVGSGIMALATDMSNIVFYTSSSLGTTGSAIPSNERMRIDTDGALRINGAAAATAESKLNTQITSAGSLLTLAEFRNLDYTSGTRSFIRVRTAVSAGSSSSAYFGHGQDNKTYIIANNSARGGDIIVNGDNGFVNMPSQPSFLACSNAGDTTVSAGSAIPTNVAAYNVGSCYNTSTYRFTAPIAGKYLFTSVAYYTSSGGNTQAMQVAPFINGAQYIPSGGGDAVLFSGATPNTTSVIAIGSSVILNLAAGDYVTMASRQIGRFYMGHTTFSGQLIS